MTETYENIRDHSEIIPRDVRVAWVEADQAERMLRGQYETLAEDADLNDEAKARRANELYEGRREVVERKKQAAKDALIRASKSAAKSSVPRPSGEATSSTDPTKLLLDQNEANRIIRILERRDECRGVLRAAQELGVGGEWLARNDRQRELLDHARRLEYFSGLISTSAPKPPKSLGKASSNRFTQHAPAPVMVSGGGPAISAVDGSHNGAPRPKRATRRSRKNFS